MTLQPRKNIVHIEYCTNCHSHNWNTHHNQAKYHQTFIKLKNLIQDYFSQNTPIVYSNKLPHYLLPIKQQQNKYYNPLTKKYIFFPNIGSFQITLNQEIIFSKKKTNNWPCFQTVLNQISLKLYQKPIQKRQNKFETHQTQNDTDFQYDTQKIHSGNKTLYKEEHKNNTKKPNNFTLTDHFKAFHNQQYDKKISEPSKCFDSSTTIKQSPQKNALNEDNNRINVQNIQGLRKALQSNGKSGSQDESIKSLMRQNIKSNQKQILINLCSIEEQNPNIREMNEFQIKPYKRISGFMNSQIESVSYQNNSEKSLSLKKFQQFNNDLKKIQKHFKHIQSTINNRDQANLNEGESRVQQQRSSYNQAQQSRLKYSQFLSNNNLRVKDLNNFYSQHNNNNQSFINRVDRKNQLLFPLQDSQVKATDRYDQRYITPSYYQENELNRNRKCKKYSEIEKYLNANNQYKNKKLKKIYGDWKVGTNNLHYLHHLENGKRVDFRDISNLNKNKINKNSKNHKNYNQSPLNSKTVSDSSLEQKSVEQKKTQLKMKFQTKQKKTEINNKKQKIQKHPSFIIKHKSAYNNVSKGKNVQQKLSKQNKVLQKSTQVSKSFNFRQKQQSNGLNKTSQIKNYRKNYINVSKQQQKINDSRTIIKQNKFLNQQRKQYNRQEQNITRQKSVQHAKQVFKQVYNNQSPANKFQRGNSQQKLKRQSPKLIRNKNQNKQIGKTNKNSENQTLNKDKSLKSLTNHQRIKFKNDRDSIEQNETHSKQTHRKITSNQILNVQYDTNEQQKNRLQAKNEIFQKQNIIKIDFHDFELKVDKIKQQQRQTNVQKQIKEIDHNQKSTLSHNLTITNQCLLTIQADQTVISKTKNIININEDQNQLNSQLNITNNNNSTLLVPHLNLTHQDQIYQNDQNYQLSNIFNSKRTKSPLQKSQRQKSLQNSKRKSHSRTSSLYEQPTYAHNHQNHAPCKCSHKNQQLQTNREKILSQRKQKQILKEKRFQDNKKRRQLLQKQKQLFLAKIQEEKQQQQLQKSQRQKNMSQRNKIKPSKLWKQSKVQKSKSRVKSEAILVPSKTAVYSNERNASKESKNSKQVKSQSLSQVNKAYKSRTNIKQQKSIHQLSNKSYSMKQNQKSMISDKLSQQKKSFSSHSQLSTKSPVKSNKVKSKNKSYFKIQKENRKYNTIINNRQTEEMSNIQLEGKAENVQHNSIAIQTTQRGQSNNVLNVQRNNKRSNRTNSVQSRNSTLKSLQRNQIVKQTYAPQSSKISKKRLSKTDKNGFKFKNKQQLSKFQNKTTDLQEKIAKNKEQTNQNQDYSCQNIFQSQKSINSFVDQFYEDKNQQNIDKQNQKNIENKRLLLRFDRQHALILKQLYGMKNQIQQEQQKYQKLYREDNLYKIISQKNTQKDQTQVIMQENIRKMKQFNSNKSKEIVFQSLQKIYSSKISEQHKSLKLFDIESIQINKLKSNLPYLTKNLHKVFAILAQKNQLLIARLFQDYKSQTKFVYNKNHEQFVEQSQQNKGQQSISNNILVQKSKYGVWLCVNQIWRLIVVNNSFPSSRNNQDQQYLPLFTYHSSNQLWPLVLEKALAIAVEGYENLFNLSVGELFSILTGSNHLTYSIKQNISKNKTFLKQISDNQKKNFIMICQRHSLNLKQQAQKQTAQTTKLYYLLSKKVVNNNNNNNDDNKQQTLFKMRQVTISSSDNQVQEYQQPYYTRYDKFCQTFKFCEVLHLRQYHNFCSMKLNQSSIMSKKHSKKDDGNNYFNVIQIVFQQASFGTITVSNTVKSDLKTYLYKLEHNDNQIMKLVGQAQKINKTQLFFDCYFQSNRYYLFIQCSNSNSVISYMGQGKPQIKIKQQILSNGLRNQSIEYLPVTSYEGFQNMKNTLGQKMQKTKTSQMYASKFQQKRKPNNMEDLRQMFIQLMLQQRKTN